MKYLNVLICFVLFTFVSSQAAIIEVAPANARMSTMILGGGVPAAGSGTATFRAYSVAVSGGSDTITIAIPTNTASGDMMIAFICTDWGDGSVMDTPPSGWTAIDTSSQDEHSGWSYYKESAGETGNIDWGFDVGGRAVAHIVSVSKDSGSWVTPDTAGYHSVATTNGTVSTTGSVTGTAGCLLVCSFTNDGLASVSSDPADMTDTELTTPDNQMSINTWHEQRSAGAIQKSLTWSASDEITAYAVVVSTN